MSARIRCCRLGIEVVQIDEAQPLRSYVDCRGDEVPRGADPIELAKRVEALFFFLIEGNGSV